MTPVLRISLEISSQNPLRGVLFTEDCRARRFEGWLQLLSALSEASPEQQGSPDAAAMTEERA